jgi:hypothetical protein
MCGAQQLRQGESGQPPSSNRAIEYRLQSKHPPPGSDANKPVPGKYLLGRAAARAEQLRLRVRATDTAHLRASGSLSAVLPGIQLRANLPAGSMANSVAAGDFNRDGHMDFVVANGGTNDLWIYFGKGDGTFELPRVIPLTRGQTPVYILAADLRGNGILDLIVAEYDTWSIGVLLGNGDGTFGYEQIYYVPQPPAAIVIDDFNHDGKLDIACVMDSPNDDNYTSQYVAVLLGDGSGSFGNPVISLNTGLESTADSIVSGDVNGDGLPDLLITDPGYGSQIYINAGNGMFTPGYLVAEPGPLDTPIGGALADINGDGCLDALVADLDGFTWVSPGDCKGNFPTGNIVPMGDSSSQIAIADINGDGRLDILTTSTPSWLSGPGIGDIAGNNLCVAFGDGQGNFSPGRVYTGTGESYSLALADFNGDGKTDVVTVSPDTDTSTVYLNDGSGGFGFPQGAWVGVPNYGIINAPLSPVSFADVNGDGKPDVVLLDSGVGNGSLITVMLNDGTGRLSGPTQSGAGASNIGDFRLGNFRNTGRLDFVGIGFNIAYSSGQQFIVFLPGNGDGTFGTPTVVSTPGADGAMAIGDFNGDGKLDFVAVGESSSGSGKVLSIFLGNADGTFGAGTSVPFNDSAEDVSRVFAGDFNRDGKLDVLVYTTGNGYWTKTSSVWEFLGNGDGTFKAGTQLFSSFQPMTMADVNGDSWPDIVRYDFFWPGNNETYGPVKFTTYLDQPSGTFAQSSTYTPYAGVPTAVKPYLQMGDPLATSLVTDLNGDGKLDEIAFQQVSPSNYTAYAQILMGDGDGTFTPTYDVFNFNKEFSYPYYARDLNADGFSDLLELDGATSSLHVFLGGAAPALQIELQLPQISGTSGCGWVFLNVPSASDSVISLSSTIAGVVLPASVTVPAGSLSQQFCYTLDSTYDWHNVFDVTATSGSNNAVAYGSQSYVFGFSESLSSTAAQVIYPTQSTTPITVSLTSSQGYTSTVQMSCLGLPAGATCVFGSDTLNVSPTQVASTTVVINTTSATQGINTVQILASDAEVTTRQSFSLTVQPLTVGVVPGLPPASSPGSAVGEITIFGLPPYKPSCSGLPSGVTCAFTGKQLPYPSFTDLTMTVTAPSGIQSGSYPFTVQVTSGPQTASAGATLNITGFTLQGPTSATDWAPPGGNMSVILGVLPVDGFNGTVSVTCTVDFGGTCSGGSYSVAGTSAIPVNVVVSVPSGLSAGSHTLNVSATSGSLTSTAAFPFYIADYSGTLSQSVLSMQQGGSGSLTATVNATTGFGGTVSFACTGASQISCTFSPSTVQPTGTTPQTTNVTMSSSNASNGAARTASSWVLALIMPLAMFLGLASKRRSFAGRLLLGFTLLTLTFLFVSCGGSSGGGSGGGPATYSITVNASVAGSNTTRSLGTVNVTVTQ